MARRTREQILTELRAALAAGTIRNVDYKDIAEDANRALDAHEETVRAEAGRWWETISDYGRGAKALKLLHGRPSSVLHVPGWLKRARDKQLSSEFPALAEYCSVYGQWSEIARLLVELKPMRVKGRIVREKTEAEQEAERIEQANRRTCQCCGMHFVVRNGNIVLHGYNRPGVGYIVGDCFGHGYPPFEVSRDRLGEYINVLVAGLVAIEAGIDRLRAKPESITVATRKGYKDYRQGDADYERALAIEIAQEESRERQQKNMIIFQQARFDKWHKRERPWNRNT